MEKWKSLQNLAGGGNEENPETLAKIEALENELRELKQNIADRIVMRTATSGTLELSGGQVKSQSVEVPYLEGHNALFAYVTNDTSKYFVVKYIYTSTRHEAAESTVNFRVRNDSASPDKGSLDFNVIYIKE